MSRFWIAMSAALVAACTASGGLAWHAGGASSTSASAGGGGGGGGGGGSSGGSSRAVVSPETTAAIAAHGHAFDVNKDCYGDGGSIDYHRAPVLYWPCFDFAEHRGSAEYSTFAKNCDAIGEAFDGAPMTCRIEHRGFDEHFAAQAKVARNADRDGGNPGNYCDMIFGEFAGRVALHTNTMGMLQKPRVRGEFLGKVKTLACAYDDAKAGTAEVANGTLTFYAGQKAGEGWVYQAMIRTNAFPALEAYVQEYGACQGGYSC